MIGKWSDMFSMIIEDYTISLVLMIVTIIV